MNLPSIPTDNLYKFCAVSGVVLLLFGATFPVQKLFETQNNVDRARTEINILAQQVAFLAEDQGSLHADLSELENKTDAAVANLASANLPSLRARTATVRKTVNTVSENRRQLLLSSIRLKGNVDHATHLIHRMWLYIAGAAMFMFGGLALSRFGFMRWYDRVQKPADELLTRQTSDGSS